jgi:dipeptidyl aminopeptidase/acylaminoacyl peptidase
MRTRLLAVVLVLGVSGWQGAGAQDKRPATFEDVLAVKAVGNPVLSPDGARVLYTVREWEPPSEREKDRREARTRIWLVPVDGSTPARQITYGERGDTQPQWSPNGRFISFLSARGPASGDDGPPKAQIYVMPADGGEGRKLTTAKEGVTSYAWSPDSGRIAYLTTDPRNATQEADLKKRDDERVFEGDFRYAHAWVIPVALDGTSEATRLTQGTDYTLSGVPSWAPDGSRFVIGGSVTPLLRDNRRDIYVVNVAGATAEKISTNFGSDTQPRWSPDGRTIAWTADPYTGAPVADGTAPGGSGDVEEHGRRRGGGRAAQAGRATSRAAVPHASGGAWRPCRRLHQQLPCRRSRGRPVPGGQGWAIFYPNPRGSTNYGETFLKANVNDWGGGDYRDIMTGSTPSSSAASPIPIAWRTSAGATAAT